MNKRIAAWAGAIAVVCLILLVAGFFIDRRTAPPARAAGHQGYAGQMAALDTAYERGKQVRKKMLAHKIRPTRARCVALYRATAASELGNTDLEAEVEPFYVAGCLNQKRLK